MSHCGFDFYFPGDFIKEFFVVVVVLILFLMQKNCREGLETDLLVAYSSFPTFSLLKVFL